jgi:hypothetical protein
MRASFVVFFLLNVLAVVGTVVFEVGTWIRYLF